MRHIRLLAAVLLVAAGARAAEPDALETRVAALVNAERARHKLPQLTYHPGLARVAHAHSVDMRDHRFFAHKSTRTGKVADRLAAARIPHRGAGENIARATTVEHAHANLMSSPPHRKNILHTAFTHLGVGAAKARGTLLVTEVFIRAVPVYDPAAVRKDILEGINDARRKKGLRRLLQDDRLMRIAQEYSERAEQAGRAEHLRLHRRTLAGGGRWRVIQSRYFLTDTPADVARSDVALGRRFDHYGVGVTQTSPHSKTAGALWIILIAAQR